MCDALNTAVGAVLQQYIGDRWCPITYFSKQLQPAQTRYSTFDRKLLAIYLSIKHFQHFIEGRQFLIYTDHKPLTYFTIHLGYTPCERCSKRSSGCIISPTRKCTTCTSEHHHRLQRAGSHTGEWYRTCWTKIASFITRIQRHAINDVRLNSCLWCLDRFPSLLRAT